ncbi:MAG: hypothetical protein ACW99Q_21920, partial [Candidatus Kariarchaeaceae archaeon]
SGYGLKSVEIHANQTFFNNQSKLVQFTILGNTTLNYYNFVNNSNFNSSQYFNITIEFYDEIKELGIDADDINYSLNGGIDWRYDNIEPLGNGQYNITVYCNDINFTNYGPQVILVDVNKSFYENQTIRFDITITGDTNLTLIKYPDKLFYYSDEILNITAHFNDTSRNQGIDGANVQIYVKNASTGLYDLYSTNIIPENNGDYNITVNCSDSIFERYGWFDLKINASKQYYHNASGPSLDHVIGTTSLTLIDPAVNSVFIKGEIFNVTVQFYDVVKPEGIDVANINYTLDGNNYRGDNVTPIGSGRYVITIYVNDSDFSDDYGFRTIQINASKQHYKNLTYPFTFHRQMTTTINPSNIANLGPVMRGLNVSYRFNYSETDGDPISKASWEMISSSYNFITFLENEGDGNYTMHLDTTNVNVPDSPFNVIFNISAIGNETQVISLNIEVTIIQTNIENLNWNAEFARNAHLNQTVSFFFRDTTNDLPVSNLITNDTKVKNFATGTLWNTNDFNWRLINQLNGNYILDISTNGLDSGWYTLELNVSKDPNYDFSLAYATFYLRGNYSQINLISIGDPGGALSNISQGHHYRIFEGSDIDFEFNITDLEFNNNLVLDAVSSYFVSFKNLNTSIVNTLQSTFQFIPPNHIGPIITSVPGLSAGNYLINISTAISNYENATFTFNLTVIEKYDVRITVIDKPGEVTAGNVFDITIEAEYFDGSSWLPLLGESIILTPFFDGTAGNLLNPILTNNSGFYFFEVPTRTDAENITLTVAIQVAFNHLGNTIDVLDIDLIPPPPGLDLSDLIPYIILIGVALAAVGGSVGIYKGVVVPKKREKTRILNEVKTIFDDAINLEHILVLYKGTGTCIYFKSFGSEEIDPELISGFISAICSFGRDL